MTFQKKMITNKSLKDIGNLVAVVWNGLALHERNAYTDGLDDYQKWRERTSPYTTTERFQPSENADGYVLLPNVDSPATLLKMCEGFDHPLIPQAINGMFIKENDIAVSDAVASDALLEAFGIKHPTRTEMRKAKEVTENWCYPSDISYALPIKDLLAMSKDMRAIITMLIFSIGSTCAPHKLVQNTSDGIIMLDSEASGCECYRRFIEAIPQYRMPSLDVLQERYEQSILPAIKSARLGEEIGDSSLEAMREFCNELISALMSSLSPMLTWDGFYAAGEFASFAGAYAFWTNEALQGKAAVCEHCGNLFIRQRKNGRFCKPACRVAEHNSPSK